MPAHRSFARLYLRAEDQYPHRRNDQFHEDAVPRREIEAGKEPGPRITHWPAFDGNGRTDPERIAQHADDYANRGATTFKAYDTRSSEPQAAISRHTGV